MLKIIISIVICLAVGFSSGLVTADAIPNWYADLNKPFFNPPNWLFAPAWTVLYILMGIAAGMIWNKGLDQKIIRTAMIIFVIQLVLNGLWTLIFFGMKNPPLAFAEIVLLWGMILLCIIRFGKINKTAAWLMIPYILWVTFAAALNFSIWQLNA